MGFVFYMKNLDTATRETKKASWSYCLKFYTTSVLTFCSLLQVWNDIVLFFYNFRKTVKSVSYEMKSVIALII